MKTEEIREEIIKIQRIHNVEPGEAYHADYWKEHRGFIADKILAIPEIKRALDYYHLMHTHHEDFAAKFYKE